MKNTMVKRPLSAKLMVMFVVCLLVSSTVWAATAISSAMGSVTASKYAGTGTTADPYRIITTGTVSGAGAYTAPSQFWGDTSQPNGVGTFAVKFEQFTGNTTEGTLINSFNFDLGQNATSVWDGTWTYAFRFPAWSLFDTSTGNLRMAFAYKGNFDTYWEDWSYKFNVQSLTSGLAQDKRIQPGETVKITYYGNYFANQTSRGTYYATDFSVTDQNASATYYAVVDGAGYATFFGANAIEYGGNYSVEKVQ